MRLAPCVSFTVTILLFTGNVFCSDSLQVDCKPELQESLIIESETLRVATLNLAHGRKDSANQMLLSDEAIRKNVLEVAGLLDRLGGHVVALQEADATSAWSGDFNHVALLLANSGYSCSLHGLHASNRLYEFGTAVMSVTRFHQSASHDFEPSWPTTTKGFTVGEVAWNPAGSLPEPLIIRVVSVHLDFSRRSVRRSQVEELVRILSKRSGPIILMGDFNSDWHEEESSVKQLSESLGLVAFEPGAEDHGTYGDKGVRLDWILVSPELTFVGHQVLTQVVSDHLAVVADLQFGPGDQAVD